MPSFSIGYSACVDRISRWLISRRNSRNSPARDSPANLGQSGTADGIEGKACR